MSFCKITDLKNDESDSVKVKKKRRSTGWNLSHIVSKKVRGRDDSMDNSREPLAGDTSQTSRMFRGFVNAMTYQRIRESLGVLFVHSIWYMVHPFEVIISRDVVRIDLASRWKQ